jgi:hypothetical protein
MADLERPGMDAGSSSLFSVDADAHLQKLASSMFPTPAQLPVELVRAALKRKATAVAMEIRRTRLTVTDDGEAIAAGPWQMLACALDRRRSPVERETAIAALQAAAAPGIGLLAVLLPDAGTIRIKSPGRDGRPALHVSAGEIRWLNADAGTWGTRIVISRRSGPVESEIKLFRELCAAAPAEITLNGRKIARKPVLRRTLVQQNAAVGPGRETALVAVPARGDICRIWLLDQGIPWQVLTSPSCHGLVFDAALESAAAATGTEFARLAAAAGRLYQWLAEHYSSFPQPYQDRIEELIFKKVRTAGDLRLLSAFAPFRLWRCQQRLNLEEVRRKAEVGPLYALPHGGDPGRFLGSHQEALLLTPAQRDFLLNHMGLPLVIPPATMGRPGWLALLISRIQGSTARWAGRLPRRRFKALDAACLDDLEARLCREMELYGRSLRHHPPLLSLAVAMTAGRGLAPSAWRQGAGGGMLFLRRRHPLVRAAARSVARDRANVELAFMALAPGIFLTAGRH